MRLLKPIKPIFIILTSIVLLVILAGTLFLTMPLKEIISYKQKIADVKLQNFIPGTQVNYQISSNNKIIAKNNTVVKENGVLSLPINKNMLSKQYDNKIKYKLDINTKEITQQDHTPLPADLLRIILDLDTNSGNIGFSAQGLEKYSNIQIKNENKENILNSDWAGLFSTVITNNNKTSHKNTAQFAFQNFGIESDLIKSGSPKIDVQLTASALGAPSTGSSLEDVLERWSSALIRMTEQLSAVMELQTEIIGTFFDANIQLRTQRKLQELQAQAHKDYHPSEQLCRIGTFIRSIAHTESKSELEKKFLNKYLIEQYTGTPNTQSGEETEVFENAQILNYRTNYCNPNDNNAATRAICEAVTSGTTAETLENFNKDIDYTRTLSSKLTLDINFTDATISQDEKDIIALSKYLYSPSTYNVGDTSNLTRDVRPHYDSRSYAAKMEVAHNSFINIVGMKAAAPEGHMTITTTTTPPPAPFGTGSPIEPKPFSGAPSPGEQTPLRTEREDPTILDEDSGWAYMKALLREFNIDDPDIDKILGERPSYYAQMEILTKKIYQHPNFYTNLYDKPANVKRIGAAIDAITLMNQRDRFESLLRIEMLSAVLVEESLQKRIAEINTGIEDEMKHSQFNH